MALRTFGEAIIYTIVFGFFIIAFATYFLGSQNPNSDAVRNGGDTYGLNTSMTSLNAQISGFEKFSNDTKTTFGNANPKPLEFVFLIFEGAFYVPKLFLGFFAGGMMTLITVIFSLGGGGWGGILAIASSIIIAILLIRLVLYIIQSIRTGVS